jgi:hypothetical protein
MFHCNYIGGVDVGHPILEGAAAGPSQRRDRRGKGTRTSSSDMSVDTEEESAEGTDVGAYLNQDMFTAQIEIF